MDLAHEPLRRVVIGGSEVSALFDINPYLSLYKLWHIKNQSFPHKEFDAGNAAKRGQYFEDGVARWAADELGATIYSPNVFLTRSDMPGLGGTPDRYIRMEDEEGEGILECKTMNFWMASKWEDRTKPPPHYALQTELYVHLKKANYGWLAIHLMSEDAPPLLFRIEPNEEHRKMLVDGAAAFWQSIKDGIEPMPDASDLEELADRKRAQSPEREFADLSANNYIVDLCSRFTDNAETMKRLKEESDKIKAELTLATMQQKASNFYAAAFQGTFTYIDPTPDKIITSDMVGQVLNGRAGSTRLTIKRRKK